MNEQYENTSLKKIIITDLQYFGSINWYKMFFEFSDIFIEQYEVYQKMSFRNRCIIAGSNGLINLTVPLEKGRGQKLIMKDVRISYSENWQRQHWRSIFSSYRNSPFFEYYEESLNPFFEKKHVYLFDLNWEIMEWVNKRIKFSSQVHKTRSYDQTPNYTNLDSRNVMTPKNFDQGEVNLKYQQVFEDRIGFKTNLCILDLMFCNGPASKSLLSKG